MPTYEYECRKCGHQFERFQSITAPPVKTCPKCKGKVARLLSGGAGIIFKGSGFYQTDYRRGTPPASGGGSNAAKETSGKKPAAAEPAKA